MNAVEIEAAVSELFAQPLERETFPYAFLQAFGNKQTTIDRLRASGKNSTNSSDLGGVLQKLNIHIAVAEPGGTPRLLEALRASPATAKAKAQFVLATSTHVWGSHGKSITLGISQISSPRYHWYCKLSTILGYTSAYR